jgi:tetratricopeptide (TPR) repeat protein
VDETQAWADRYDREIEDIFDIQDEVMKEIVTALRLRLTSGQEAVVQARGTTNIEAWKYCVLARTSFDKLTATDHLEARVLAEKALPIDPNYAYAWAILSASYMREGRLGQTERKEALRKAKEYNDKALSADKSLALAIGGNAVLLSTMAGPVEGTLASRRAIEMHPGDADLRALAAYALSFAGQHEEALECVKIAIDLNPHAPSWYRMVVVRCCALLNRFEAAASLAEELLEQQPGLVAPLIFLAYSAHQMRQPVRAKNAVSRLRRYAPHMKQSTLPGFLSLPDAATVERIVCALGEAGLPD